MRETMQTEAPSAHRSRWAEVLALAVLGAFLTLGGCTGGRGSGFDALRGGGDHRSSDTTGTFEGFDGGSSSGGQPPKPACKQGGVACSEFSECCSGTCAQNACTACAAPGASCLDGTPCCDGTCFAGRCRAECSTLSCSRADECCSGACS